MSTSAVSIALFTFFIVAVVFIATSFKRSERKRRTNLSPIERLWEDYQKLNSLSPSGQTVAGRIEACLVAEIKEAETVAKLDQKLWKFLDQDTHDKVIFWERPGSSLQKTFSERRAELKENESNQATVERARLKKELLVKIFESQTATDAMRVYHECSEESPESWFAIFMQEKLAKAEVEKAESIDDIITASESAPTELFPHNTALYIAFLKLHARQSQIKS